MQIHINPGSGPVNAATEANAESNIRQFVADLTERGHKHITTVRCENSDYGNGRFCFAVGVDGDAAVEVQMPGLPLDQVRWLGAEGQNIWDFPRLYVDDGSWIWFFALDQFEADDYQSRQPDGTVGGGEPYVFTRVTLVEEARDDRA